MKIMLTMLALLAFTPGAMAESPIGTSMPPATQIVDSENAVWTFGSSNGNGFFALVRNGVDTGGIGNPLRYCSDRRVYTIGQDGSLWFVWQSAGWVRLTTTMPSECTAIQSPIQTVTLVLTWQDNSTDDPATPESEEEDGFVIQRSIGGASLADLATTGKNISTFTDSIATDTGGVTYCYAVAAFNVVGRSAFTPQACATSKVIVGPNLVPIAPTNLVAQ